MREGLVPSTPTHVMRLATDMATATRLAGQLGEMLDADENAVAAFESADETHWLLEVFFSHPPDTALIKDLLRIVLGPVAGDKAAAAAQFETIEPKDWIAASLDGLKPVRAGRFLVHGSHDRPAIRSNDIAIEIEAALAFGTGHHGTTHGCLLLLDRELKRNPPRKVLDVGTGTGVLAIAAARALKLRVVAGDIDPVSTDTSRQNALANGAGPYVRPVTAVGVQHPDIKSGAPYDLILANILAKPLRMLAPSLVGVSTHDARLILSGLLPRDVAGVLTAYRGQGFSLFERLDLDGWVALVLKRKGAAQRPLHNLMP
ncbi:MAG: 50S ribosomal protein L11 methyltransferase [Beijerinckiaceae bacterium]